MFHIWNLFECISLNHRYLSYRFFLVSWCRYLEGVSVCILLLLYHLNGWFHRAFKFGVVKLFHFSKWGIFFFSFLSSSENFGKCDTSLCEGLYYVSYILKLQWLDRLPCMLLGYSFDGSSAEKVDDRLTKNIFQKIMYSLVLKCNPPYNIM